MTRCRPALAALLTLLVGASALASGDPAPLPPGASIVAESLDGNQLQLYVDLAGHDVDEVWLEGLIRDTMQRYLVDHDHDLRGVAPWGIDRERPDDGWVPLVTLLPQVEPVPTKPHEPQQRDDAVAAGALVAADAPGRTQGALAGKVVYISAGHGFTWTVNDSGTFRRWATQRPNTNDIVEDLVSAEAINHYLIPYLENAGATVFTVRERDMNPELVIVDGDAGGASVTQGGGSYTEHGPGWFDSSQSGFAAGLAPYQGTINPFTSGANRVVAAVSGAPTARAEWVPNVPSDGYYRVYVSYTQHDTRVNDAHYVVRHPGGETDLRVNQERHGRTWVDLGQYWFYAGQDAANGAVILYNDSAEPGDFISADAVRLGGGMGDFERGTGTGAADGPLSNRPRWEECSRYSAQFSGAPTSVYDVGGSDRSDDISTRARYADWQNEPGEDAVYVAWHTNAPDPGRGTSTYIYGENGVFQGSAGSPQLAQAIHSEIINDIKTGFDASWNDRGIRYAHFSEVNPNNNDEMPSVLVEVAFHDTAADADFLKQPRFRQAVARAYYQGIVKYFAQRDGGAAKLAPEPPEATAVVALGESSARVTWSAPAGDQGDPATGYRVYRSDDGRAFDDGTAVQGATQLAITNLAPGVPTYVRVTATNAGGESFATPTLVVSPGCDGGDKALLVHGFYRLDGASLPTDDLSIYDLGQPRRLRQDEVNTFAYLVEHARAFAAAGVAFDSAEATAVADGDIGLVAYDAVDWQLGEESTVDETFSATEQSRVTTWLQTGGDKLLIASGAEVAWDLDEKGSAADQAFIASAFGARYAADRSAAPTVTGAGPLSGVPALTIDDGTLGAYLVFYPDVLTPQANAVAALSYSNGDGAAATWFEGAGFDALLMGVPLEALHPESARNALIAAVLDNASITPIPAQGCGVTPPVDTGGAEPTPDAGPADTTTPPDTTSTVDTGGPTQDIAGSDAGVAVGIPSRAASLASQTDAGCAGGGLPIEGAWALLAVLVLAMRRQRQRAVNR